MVKIQSRIEDAKEMIRHSKIKLYEFETRKTSVEGKETRIYLEVGEGLNFNDKPKFTNLEFTILQSLFTIVDSIANEIKPEKIDSDFIVKQNSLPDSSMDERIFKECYRILRLMRNFSVHSFTSISSAGENCILFESSSDERKKGSKLLITKKGLDYLASYVVAYASDKDIRYTEKHRSEILKSYYTEFRKGLKDFDDGVLEPPLLTVEEINAYFKITVRYYVENPSYEFTNLAKMLLITSGLPDETDNDNYSRDYLIYGKYFKNKRYLVPHEDLDSENKILIKDMEEYILN